MKVLIKDNWLFLTVYAILALTAAYFMLQYDKVHLHSYLNRIVGNPFFDTFFKYITHCGDGIIAGIIAFIAILLNARNGVFVFCAYAFSGLTTSFLKNYVFEVNRPHFVFGYYGHYFPEYKVKYIEGVDLHILNSFPSGHSTTAFAIFISMALITKNKWLKFFFFLVALLSAFSRTYLSQHWLVDVTVGSLIGTGYSILFYWIIIERNKLQKLNKPLLSVFNT